MFFSINVFKLFNFVRRRLREDLAARPELTHASIEIAAPAEYMVRQPMPPVFAFLIDISSSAMQSGMVAVAAQTIRENLSKLPGGPRTMVAFMTFDSTVHFYGLDPNASSPQMYCMPDLEDVFLPAPNHLLVNLEQSRDQVEAFLDSLSGGMHASTRDVESAVGPALDAARLLIHRLGGKIITFLSGLPCLGAGNLQNRENSRILGTDQEHVLLKPANDYYKRYAIKSTQYQIGVSLYLFANSYIDVSTLSELAAVTGGEV